MKRQIAILIAAICILFGCGDTNAEDWKEGGLYSTENDNGSYSVLKILKIDDHGVHVRLYSNQFSERPVDVDESTLYLAGFDKKPEENLGVEHVPLSKETFSKWGARYLKTVPVTEEELEVYKMWLKAKGGYF